MATYRADIAWTLAEREDFPAGRYGRGHTIRFDGGTVMPASASPRVVGKWAVEAAVDPEEMLVAALSSCHRLTVLHAARRAGLSMAPYDDRAEGTMAAIAPGRQAVTRVVLRPTLSSIGATPDAATLDRLHYEAHRGCFIANSIRTEVSVEAGGA